MARVLGSYPIGRWFESCCRYHFGPLVKRLRHRPFTAESWVQFPYGSPDSNARKHKLSGVFSFCGIRCRERTRCAVSFLVWERIVQERNAFRIVAPKRLLQLSAAGEVFLEGTCPLSRCPQTAKFPAPLLLGARRRWVRKATAFRGRSEQDRSALVSRLLCCDFGNISVECFQRVIPFSELTDTAQPVFILCYGKSTDTARRVPTMGAKHLANCAQLDQLYGETVLKLFRFRTILFAICPYFPSCFVHF